MKKILILIIVFTLLSMSQSAMALTANFTYSVSGANISCTNTSTGNVTGYKWEISNDGVIFGSTDWINDSSGNSQIFTYPNGGNICIILYVKNGSAIDFIMKCIGSMPGNNKDKYPAEEYYNCKACEDIGYYWYNNSCHNTLKILPWNVKNPLPEASMPVNVYQVNLGKLNVDLRLVFVVLIGIGLLWIAFGKKKKNK